MAADPGAAIPRLPRAIWTLGIVSLLMDVSSEMIHSLLPLFLVTTLGATTTVVGLIEGVSEATVSFTKIFSGALSDHLRKRKLLALIGYGTAAATKPVFPLATSAGQVFAARVVDRIGKGIRGAPRDALLGDLAPPERRGAAFGLRQALDTVGAVAGPLLAILLMIGTGGDYRLVFWCAALPAVACVLTLLFGVSEPEQPERAGPRRWPLAASELRRMPRSLWSVIGIAALLTLPRFSEAFLLLKAKEAGLREALVPLALVTMNVSYALSAYPAGHWSDRLGPRRFLLAGFVILALADALLAATSSMPLILAGIAGWGLHFGLTQGLLAAMVAQSAPAELRGTAFGLYHLATGFVLFLASLLAGKLWDAFGSAATFTAGAAAAALASLLLAGRWLSRAGF